MTFADSLMAKIISPGRRVYGGGARRVSRDIKVLSCSTTFAPMNPNTFGYTIPIGLDVWLLRVRVWLFLLPGATAEIVQFKMRTGMERPATIAEIQRWRLVLPIMVGDREAWWVSIDKSSSFVWEMEQAYFDMSRRFGIEVLSLADVGGQVNCSFEVESAGR